MDFLTNMIPAFGNIGFTLLAFIIALSVIVAIHEYGHYIVGRWSGIHADVFSIGFGKVLWSRVDKRGTVWQIAALPFGGYVKFRGDANAASVGGSAAPEEMPVDRPDDTRLSEEAKAYVANLTSRNSMLGAPLWARSATVVAGPVFNFILSVIVFACLMMYSGRATTPLTVDSVIAMPAQITMELEPGDQVIAIEDVAIGEDESSITTLSRSVPSQPTLTYEVRRDGAVIEVEGPQLASTRVGSITPRSAADDAGLRIGDVVLSMDGTPVYTLYDMINVVEAVRDQEIALEVWRDGEILNEVLTPRLTAIPQEDGSIKDEPKLGIAPSMPFDPVTERVGPGAAFKRAVEQVWYIIRQSINSLGALISGAINTCNLSGPVGIAETSGSMASQGTFSFISFIAVLSTAVGLLNLFPIPVLDGGHLVFHAYEAVTGKMPSDGALRIFMAIGLAMIGTLMVFAVGNDLLFCP
ncbi:RIP metalloprotease RseP [Octadecabacter sp.]|nr:RIP metalloprotease RseP [Octadecabacter sp.]